jgi:hypothetical protein
VATQDHGVSRRIFYAQIPEPRKADGVEISNGRLKVANAGVAISDILDGFLHLLGLNADLERQLSKTPQLN